MIQEGGFQLRFGLSYDLFLLPPTMSQFPSLICLKFDHETGSRQDTALDEKEIKHTEDDKQLYYLYYWYILIDYTAVLML